MVSCFSDNPNVLTCVSPAERRRSWLLGLIYWTTLLPLSVHPHLSGNVWSRYLTVESLVERGTLVVEQSPFLAVSGTPDLVQFKGHLYSDKPPVLSIAGAALYLPLASCGVRFSKSMDDFKLVNLVLVAFTASAASALTVVCLRRLLGQLRFQTSWADALAIAFGYGSLLLPYSTTFNNHSVAAGLLTAALMLVIEEQHAGFNARRSALLGGLVGLAAVVDLPAGGAALLVFGIWHSLCHSRIPLAYGAGAAPLLLLHCICQSAVTGSPLPSEMYPDAFLFPGSFWATEAGRFQETGPRWQFGLEMLLGPQGLLTITPVLVIGLAGVVIVSVWPGNPLRGAARCVAVLFTIVFVYYVWFTRRTDFAGQSYGTRHLLAISPLIYYFATALLSRYRGKLAVTVFTLLVLLGAMYAIQGVKDPWIRIEERREPILRAMQQITVYPWSSKRR